MSETLWPVLMRPGDIIGMKEAAELAARDPRTVRDWCKVYGIGHQCRSGAQWEISAPALVMVRHGDTDALELLRAGDRLHPRVARYFVFVGVEP